MDPGSRFDEGARGSDGARVDGARAGGGSTDGGARSDDDRHTLQRLEEALWQPATRGDRDWMDEVLHPDFLEFGRSGRAWSRAATLDVEVGPFEAVLPLPDFETTRVAEGVALVTYRSIFTRGGTTEHARRSSLWVMANDRWQLRFHQGTPLATEADGDNA